MRDAERSLNWRQAALALEARLRQLTGQAPELLDILTIKHHYPRRHFIAGWRFRVSFADGVVRRIDVLATSGFPSVLVRTALVDHPEFLTWPHVESDGILCLLPNMAEVDPDDPGAVSENLFIRSCRLIDELLEGGIVERDFREEFLTYWAYKVHPGGGPLYSLLKPMPPSREVCVWQGKGIQVVGEDTESLRRWLRRRFGDETDTAGKAAALLWLDEPPLPADYPEKASDLRVLAGRAGNGGILALDSALREEPDEILAVIGAVGRGGPGLVAAKALNPKYLRSGRRSPAAPLSKGFRPGKTPRRLLVERYFGAAPVVRTSVSRADAAWIHGRGQDPRTERLLDSKVIFLGCGSVGAPVAVSLAQAGVGQMTLVDPEALSWPNVGRHPLGATVVGQNKAEALAARLQTDYPHLGIEGISCDVHWFLERDQARLEAADLIIAATGNWAAESALNRWHVEQGRTKPVLYGWTEAHACAGHAVVISRDGGCLQCHIGRTGVAELTVVTWPDGGDANQEEPACGAHFQPYGPVELACITTMISGLSLECLLEQPEKSFHRVYAAGERRVRALGGRWSDQWLAEDPGGSGGARTADRDWPRGPCVACAATVDSGVA
jgi:molybdopterin/thiamine biosynthesis adenylyltransferase